MRLLLHESFELRKNIALELLLKKKVDRASKRDLFVIWKMGLLVLHRIVKKVIIVAASQIL